MRHLRVSGTVLAAMALLTACTPTTASIPELSRPTEAARPGVVTSTVTGAQLGPARRSWS
ncbi:hypothetical protein EUA06_19670 [Nocardioides glacieisoli]|uniref:Uncharacterized protein n=1 Tax=Nocardioides glacieisoli TaxID=1168730 RepID=A0A4Q2RNL1_9ACTN|nr:hypothetical protein [Nocardioides glacieisoli]RYB88713.1 hypothetical protein EUA06_19670 [Nocardioides glacieisoli]